MGIAKQILVGSALSLAACVGDVPAQDLDTEEVALAQTGDALCGKKNPPVVVDVDARRSLAITEEPILAGFSFERVLNQLVAQANVPGLTSVQLFNQWWDTQNRGSAGKPGAHCDDELDDALGTTLNSYPYTCREAPSEGLQATCNPFTDASCKYIPIGLFSRFDLAPSDGAHCGEYRIVYAKETGIADGADRNLVIFEAALPNPSPRKGLSGCRDIVSFWANLSKIDDMATRREKLERFYFRGLDKYTRAVVDYRNFGDNEEGFGQVRTNQFMGQNVRPRVWTLREFKLEKTCTRTARHRYECKLEFVPVTAKSNPWGGLFAEAATHPLAQDFQRDFLDQIDSLSATTAFGVNMHIDDAYNSGQSDSSGTTDTNYLAQFVEGSFQDSLGAALAAKGSTLSAIDIINRAQTQSCAGCHQFSNNDDLGNGLVWPASLGFVHVSERDAETVDGVKRFQISPALVNEFLPARKAIMESFLAGKQPPKGGYRRRTLGGHASH